MPLSYSTSGTAPRTGYGQVPGPIGIPPNIFSQLSGAVPNFGALTSGTGNLIQSQQSGAVSPQTLNALKTGAAQFGVASGMPGSGLETNQLFGNIAGFSEGQQEKGIHNYLAMISGLGPTMTNPNLAAEISARNADYAAAPDPQKAAEEQFNLWLRGLNAAKSASTPGGSWAAGGTLGPMHTNWGGMGINPPQDSLGFPGFNMTPEYSGTIGPIGALPERIGQPAPVQPEEDNYYGMP